jgi:enoyl-CoA hydratase/3-hydroxyacyl-CoA dehydrogenase
MGRDVAGLLANAGYLVTLVDVDPNAIDAARCYHETDLAVALEIGGLEMAGTPADRIK